MSKNILVQDKKIRDEEFLETYHISLIYNYVMGGIDYISRYFLTEEEGKMYQYYESTGRGLEIKKKIIVDFFRSDRHEILSQVKVSKLKTFYKSIFRKEFNVNIKKLSDYEIEGYLLDYGEILTEKSDRENRAKIFMNSIKLNTDLFDSMSEEELEERGVVRIKAEKKDYTVEELFELYNQHVKEVL